MYKDVAGDLSEGEAEGREGGKGEGKRMNEDSFSWGGNLNTKSSDS